MATMRRDLQQFITRLEVFNRVLRHNLQNQLDVVRSHAEALEEGNEHREAILDATDNVARLGARARRIDQLMSQEPEPATVDVGDAVESVLRNVDTDGVTVETTVPADVSVVTDDETLTTVLHSPIENAITYAESTVTVSAESTESGCTVEIADDGPGIPPGELDTLAAGRETPLQHSRGLGLWELKWGVDKLDGDLSFLTEDGTTVVVRLPDLDAT
jgi:signal transduction histidine kinase